MSETLPLFPLRVVLFPGSRLQLRIFERRYVDLIRGCLCDGTGFGIPPIRQGNEAGTPATPWPGGTLVHIRDFDQGEDGLLHLVVEGARRFRLLNHETTPDGLLVGEIEWLAEDVSPCAAAPAPDDLRQVLLLIAESRGDPPPAVEAMDARTLVYRILDALPISLEAKLGVLLAETSDEQLQQCRELLARVLHPTPDSTH